jgi:hypothetical protein
MRWLIEPSLVKEIALWCYQSEVIGHMPEALLIAACAGAATPSGAKVIGLQEV